MAEVIRLATREDQGRLEDLWDSCFEKRTEPFFQFYFGTCFRPEECLLLEVNGELRSAVHLRRYDLCVRGVACPVTYIVGLATWEEHRGRGYASRLLSAALAESRRLGRYANILMPSAAGFYQPEGWGLYCHQWQRSAALSYLRQWASRWELEGDLEARWLALDRAADCAEVYEAFAKDFSGYACRKKEDWQRWLQGNLLEGQVLAIYRDEAPVAYAAYSQTDTELTVSEWAALDAKAKLGLAIAIIAVGTDEQKVVWQAPLADQSYLYWPDGAEHTYVWNRTFPYMMICPADLPAWWERIPTATDGQVVVALTDREGREHTYRCVANAGSGRVEETAEEALVRMSEADMMVLLMGRVSAEELSRMGRLEGSPEAIRFLDDCYPKRLTWINEWY